ncbi:hypothetical protein RD792_010998 [Penstemon davidsonii]|uniref:pyruvate decarboxylase n=1 Tax=Penstemon davidsonii TaxID=160366 RepID=A0ABR0D437_9LAMI|nr:hypothetical protein RD792_010998 [Penstemon davidsonii]
MLAASHIYNGIVSTTQTSVVQLNSTQSTLDRYLECRLVRISMHDLLSFPGDFNMMLLDHLIAESWLNLVSCCNELNVGYACGRRLSRARGVGASVVAFVVRGLRVINAIVGAYSENLM